MAAEAAEAERQKAAAKDGADLTRGKPAAPAKRKRSAPTPGRVRIVWLVCSPSGAELKSYPYAQQTEARAEAEQLTASTGKTHFVRQGEVPLT